MSVHLCPVKKRFFTHLLSIVFLFAFSFEVITGLTIHPDFKSTGTFFSPKNTSQHFLDFLSEELNESEEDTNEIRQSTTVEAPGVISDRFFYFDFTRLVNQYHAELLESLNPVAIYRFVHIWLI